MLTRWEIVQSVLTKAILQTAKAATMCMACHECAHPPFPISHFLQVQNLSPKWIAQIDNKQPKSDNAKIPFIHPSTHTHTHTHIYMIVGCCLATKPNTKKNEMGGDKKFGSELVVANTKSGQIQEEGRGEGGA